jgi:hypothetical protein
MVPMQVLSSALVTGEQVPVAQVWQVPLQRLLQQCPSTHMPDAHWVPLAHSPPCLRRQAPVALQVIVLVQVSSSPFMTVVQVPVAQVWQTPLHTLLQQRMSTHIPEAHCVPVLQTCPCLATHTP